MTQPFYLTNNLDTIDTTARYELGKTITIPGSLWADFCPAALASGEDDPGDAVLVYGINDEASASINQGEVAMIDTADYARGNFKRSTGVIAPQRVPGVYQWSTALAAGEYAWFLQKGVGVGDSNGSVTAGAQITTTSAGQITDVSSNEWAAIGVAHAAGGSSGDLPRCFFDCRGG